MTFPKWNKRAGHISPVLAAAAVMALASCVGGSQASRSASSPAQMAAPSLNGKGEVVSSLISDLRLRQSILPAGGSYHQVASAVLGASKASAESELRMKRLTAKARSKNWLPKLGPELSLTSLGKVVAELVLDQALLDNGYRKSERDFAAADVEVAAISLSVDLNQRVYDGLKLYVEAQRAGELASISQTGITRMNDFERIMGIRVDGGLSDRSEFRVISQKRAEMQATLTSEQQGRLTALAELAALAGRPMEGVSGLSKLPPDAGMPEPLAVLISRGETARTLAEVNMARAGMKPGLGVTAAVDKTGDIDSALTLDGDFLQFGRGDTMQALEEAEEVARRKIDEAVRDSDRRIVGLTREIEALTAQQVQDGRVLGEMEANISLFTEQYKAGRMTLLELTNQFESLVAARRSHASLKYQIAAARLEIALLRGVLVDGSQL